MLRLRLSFAGREAQSSLSMTGCRNVSGAGWLLVFQGDYGAAVAAEGGYSLQIAVGAGDDHYWAVAVDGVTVGGEIPASAFGMLGQVAGRLTRRRWRESGDWQTQQQG
jgi:hypothetical protein